MSDENEFENDGEGIENLRKLYKELKKANAEQAAQLAEFNASKRTASVAEILKAKGVPASAASLYNSDEVSEDAVGKWLDQYKDVFGVGGAVDENAEAADRVNGASYGEADFIQNSPERVVGSPEDIARALANASSYEDLVKSLNFPAQPKLNGGARPAR